MTTTTNTVANLVREFDASRRPAVNRPEASAFSRVVSARGLSSALRLGAALAILVVVVVLVVV